MMELGSSRCIGLAFSDVGVVGAEVRPNGRQNLTATMSLPLEDPGLLDRPAELGQQLRQVLQARGFRAKRCVVGLPTWWLTSRLIQVPPVQGQDLAAILRLAAERAFTADAGELMMDFILPMAGGAEKQVLLLATLRRHIDRVRAVCEAAGLRVEAVTCSAAALAVATAARGGRFMDDSRFKR